MTLRRAWEVPVLGWRASEEHAALVGECLLVARKDSAAEAGGQDHGSEPEVDPIHLHLELAERDRAVAAEVEERPTGEQLAHGPKPADKLEDECPEAPEQHR
jgi:hypothetical protein